MNDWSLITCPHCGTSKLEEMPADALSVFLRLLRLRCPAQANAGQLLRFLLLRLGSLPAGPSAALRWCRRLPLDRHECKGGSQ